MDKVKHNVRSDQLFFEDDEGGRARVTTENIVEIIAVVVLSHTM